jgi:hypothetical protein
LWQVWSGTVSEEKVLAGLAKAAKGAEARLR